MANADLFFSGLNTFGFYSTQKTLNTMWLGLQCFIGKLESCASQMSHYVPYESWVAFFSFSINARSINCWIGTFKSPHSWRLMKIVPLLVITPDPLSFLEQKLKAMPSIYPDNCWHILPTKNDPLQHTHICIFVA